MITEKASELNNATSTPDTTGTIITLRRNVILFFAISVTSMSKDPPQPCGNAQNAWAQRGIKASEKCGSVTIMGQEGPIIAVVQ